MEAFYLFSSLLGFGMYLNNTHKVQRDVLSDGQKEQINNKESPNGETIYESKQYDKVRKSEFAKANSNWVNSFDSTNTNIIPFFYNTLYLPGSDEKQPNPLYNPENVHTLLNIPELGKDISNKIQIDNLANSNLPNDLSNLTQTRGQADPAYSNPMLSSTTWGTVLPRPESSNMNNQRNDNEQLKHNNMVPFFGSTIKQNMDIENRQTGGKLENFTGQFPLNRPQKEVIEPLFAPTYGLTNVHGNVERRELDRYIPSNNGKKNNELPFEQVRVGPGLNKGFTSQPSGGFHNSLRINPKTTEELLVNPKLESKGLINAGKAPTQNRSLNPIVYKHKPTLLVDNVDGKRNFTTTGEVKGRTLRPEILLKETDRSFSKQLMLGAGPATDKKSLPDSLLPKTKQSRNKNYFNSSFRNAQQSEGKRMNDLSVKSYRVKPNARMVTGTRQLNTNVKSDWQKAIAPFTDKSKTTNRETTETTQYTGQLSGQTKNTVYDPNDSAKTTIRQTTENNQYTGQLSGQQKNVVYDPNDTAKTTIKETVEENHHTGQLSGQQKNVVYDPNDTAKTTIKETVEENHHTGQLSGQQKNTVYDPNDTAKTTLKETIEENNHTGQLSGQQKNTVYDPNDTAKTTIKETTQLNDYVGLANNNTKSVAYDPKDVTKTTIKETTLINDYISNAKNNTKSVVYDPTDVAKTTIKETTLLDNYVSNAKNNTKSIVFDPNDVLKTTVKETTENSDYRGVVSNPTKQKITSYTSAYNQIQNVNKEEIAKGRKPTDSSVKFPIGPNDINMEIKQIVGDSLNRHSFIKTSNEGQVFHPLSINSSSNTSIKNNLPEKDIRLDVTILDAFKQNPLTQSLSSFAGPT
jgi:hypothetical protein